MDQHTAAINHPQREATSPPVVFLPACVCPHSFSLAHLDITIKFVSFLHRGQQCSGTIFSRVERETIGPDMQPVQS